ncbi:GNAT family N-acetyltransferase [Sphingobium sp.]|uniref:GNAT family N-acetyltransferase n=1 Tax=Sphingobium sp. TaxID=1912891 RepID=UPI00260E3DA7|nr:GNAT family N-acetyltransferase [Sphingobium sp.]
MTLRLTVPEQPSDEDRDAVIAPLRAYNIDRAGDPRTRPVAILLTDDAGQHVGGLWGKRSYDWMFIEFLAIPEAHRGADHGTALMRRAEELARAQDCIGIWLDTYSFQARGFYEKMGFSLCGEIADHPVGEKRFFLSKRL